MGMLEVRNPTCPRSLKCFVNFVMRKMNSGSFVQLLPAVNEQLRRFTSRWKISARISTFFFFFWNRRRLVDMCFRRLPRQFQHSFRRSVMLSPGTRHGSCEAKSIRPRTIFTSITSVRSLHHRVASCCSATTPRRPAFAKARYIKGRRVHLLCSQLSYI